VNRELRHRLVRAGLTPHLATKAVATPPSAMWFPDGDELSAAGLVSVPERPLDVDLPAGPGAARADYAEALSASPLWQRWKSASPACRPRPHCACMRPAVRGRRRAGGRPRGGVAAAAGLLVRASPETRWLFTQVLLAQINALRLLDPAACRDLLLGDPAAHRRLPPTLAWREAEWLLGALAEAPRADAGAPAHGAGSRGHPPHAGPACPAAPGGLWRPTGRAVAARARLQPGRGADRRAGLAGRARAAPGPAADVRTRVITPAGGPADRTGGIPDVPTFQVDSPGAPRYVAARKGEHNERGIAGLAAGRGHRRGGGRDRRGTGLAHVGPAA
jgi:hypothetical protein